MEQRDLRGIIGAVKHRLPGEQSPNRDAINSAHKFPRLPTLYAVGVPRSVKLSVCFDELWRDPTTGPPCLGTSFNDLAEGAVEADVKPDLAKGARKAARDVKLVEFKNPAFRW